MPPKRKYHLSQLSPSEENRLIEIRFFHMIRGLLRGHTDTIQAVNIIEAIAGLYEANGVILSTLIQHILLDASVLKPRRPEEIVLLYRAGYSARNIARHCRCHTDTVYGYLKEYLAQNEPQLPKRTDDRQFEEIYNFVEQAEKIIECMNVKIGEQ